MIGMLRRIFKKWDILYSTALIANCCLFFWEGGGGVFFFYSL